MSYGHYPLWTNLCDVFLLRDNVTSREATLAAFC